MCTMIRKEISVLSCFYSHQRVENNKKQNKRVCSLCHIHIVVEFRPLAGGRTCLVVFAWLRLELRRPARLKRRRRKWRRKRRSGLAL